MAARVPFTAITPITPAGSHPRAFAVMLVTKETKLPDTNIDFVIFPERRGDVPALLAHAGEARVFAAGTTVEQHVIHYART